MLVMMSPDRMAFQSGGMASLSLVTPELSMAHRGCLLSFSLVAFLLPSRMTRWLAFGYTA